MNGQSAIGGFTFGARCAEAGGERKAATLHLYVAITQVLGSEHQ